MSVRMDRKNYESLYEMAKEEGSDLSKAVRDTVTRGRILLAVERYQKGEAWLGRTAELAGIPVGHMMPILTGSKASWKGKTIFKDLRICRRCGNDLRNGV